MVSTQESQSMTADQKSIDPKVIRFAPKSEGALFWNARQTLNPGEMQELRESIRDDGLLEEIVVRLLAESNTYQVIAGERRLRSILSLIDNEEMCYDLHVGKKRLAAEVYGKMRFKVLYNCSDLQACRYSIAENLKRKNLTEFELMEYCRELCSRTDANSNPVYSRKDICFIINRSASWVSQTLQLYDLPKEAQEMLATDTLPRTVALSLLKVDPSEVLRVLKLSAEIAVADVQRDKDLVEQEIKQLSSTLEDVEMTISAAEMVNDKQERRKAKHIRSQIDRKLNDAQNRHKTAISRMPRLTTDVVSRATDRANARVGKSTGMSQKSVRVELLTMRQKVAGTEKVIDTATGLELSKRDISLVMLGLEMVLGEKDREIITALGQFYQAESPQLSVVG